MSSARIQFQWVTRRFGEVTAVSKVDLEVAAGRVTVLIGPSGCGKSTLLRLAIGLVEPTEGSVMFDGQTIGPDNVQQLRRRMGYVIQEGGLFPHLTARQNVLLMARHLGREGEMGERIKALCELARFPAQALDRYPLELSGGQRQRISLMRALMLEPEVLLLDEPLGALDPMVRASLQRELKQIVRDLGQTVLMVTHDMAEAAYLADRIVLMSKGAIVQEGSLDDFRNHPANSFVSDFINAQRSLVRI